MQKSSDGGIKMKERTYVDDVDRSVYDIKDEETVGEALEELYGIV